MSTQDTITPKDKKAPLPAYGWCGTCNEDIRQQVSVPLNDTADYPPLSVPTQTDYAFPRDTFESATFEK